MATIQFFEKTGCKNNTKQKQILQLAGHTVNAVDLIKYQWSKDEILSFFADLDAKDWFNINAPAITSGQLNPETFTKQSALDALLNDHILIKRPLLIINDKHLVGFDTNLINSLIGLETAANSQIPQLLHDIAQGCTQKHTGQLCSSVHSE